MLRYDSTTTGLENTRQTSQIKMDLQPIIFPKGSKDFQHRLMLIRADLHEKQATGQHYLMNLRRQGTDFGEAVSASAQGAMGLEIPYLRLQGAQGSYVDVWRVGDNQGKFSFLLDGSQPVAVY